MSDERQRCERCGELLHPDRMTWLELNNRTHLWADPEIAPWPEDESQGGFPFGKACAKAVLKNGGVLVRTGRAAKP